VTAPGAAPGGMAPGDMVRVRVMESGTNSLGGVLI
jgi:hypothetical protein